MPIPINSKEAQEIRKLIPLATIPLSRFENICAKMTLLKAEAGEALFTKGETHKDLFYLITGEISLQTAEMQVEIINAKTCSGRFALAHQIPRKIDAIALTSVTYIRLDPDLLMVTQANLDQEDRTDMSDIQSEGKSDDWMTIILKSPIFKKLPPANLQKLLMGLESVDFPKDHIILKQGSLGEHFYLIKKGECILSRKPNPNAREINLAQLRIGDCFGEDALISDQPINVNVTALTNVALLRIDKEKFITLIKKPTLQYVEPGELANELNNDAVLLDVRLQDEFNSKHLQHSISAPFFSLRMQLQLKMFNRHRTIITLCQDGKISEAAAFLFLRNKFNAKVLRGGLQNLTEEFLDESLKFVEGAVVEATVQTDHLQLEQQSVVTLEPKIDFSKITEQQIERLIAENSHLKHLVQKLNHQCETLREEKELAEKQYRVLFKQTEKLKEVLNKLKAN